MLFILLLAINIFNIAEPVTYNIENATKMFHFYKAKYNKHYTNRVTEANGLRNFVINLNKVTSLNENATDKFHLYQLNRYADFDPQYFEKHFAVELTPYDNVLNATSGKLLRSERPGYIAPIEQSNFYDLTKVDQIYKDYLNRHKNKNYTKKRDRMIHYYKFIKSLVEINRAKMKGNIKPLDDYADVIDEPNEYFY